MSLGLGSCCFGVQMFEQWASPPNTTLHAPWFYTYLYLCSRVSLAEYLYTQCLCLNVFSSSDGRAMGVKHQEPECMWSPYTSGRFINSCYDKASLTIKPYDRRMYVWNSIELVCIKVGAYCVINLILFSWSTFDVCV